MKKISLLILSSLMASQAFAAQIELNGFGRVRSEMSENVDLNDDLDDKGNSTSYRFQMGIKASASADSPSHVFIQPRFSKTAGSTTHPNDNDGTSTSAQTSGGIGQENSIDMHQAYISHQFSDTVSIKMGRQELAYGDHLVVGTVGWSDIGRAFDGFKLTFKSDYGSTDIFSMTVKEKTKYADANRDYDFNGLYHSMSAGSVKHIDLYYLVKQDLSDAVSSKKNIVTATGIRVKSNIDLLDYRVEYTSQSVYKYDSTKADYTTESASQYDLEIGYKISKFRIALETSSASEHYDQLYPTAHKWMGFADAFKRQNIAQNALHIGYKHDAKTSSKLSYHVFSVVNTDSTSNVKMEAPSVTTSNDEKELGSEIDFTVNHKISEDLGMLVKYAVFTPGEHYKKTSSDNQDAAASKLFLQFQSKF
jgi:hypothetical protein